MTFAQVLLLMAFGIGATQSLCDGRAVTLRWLRLGDLIALSLCAVALVIALQGIESGKARDAATSSLLLTSGILTAGFAIHITLVQKDSRTGQRLAVGLLCVLIAALTLFPIGWGAVDGRLAAAGLNVVGAADSVLKMPMGERVGLILSGCVLGGVLMTMLLGHAYLTAGGEMTQAPFLKLTAALFLVIALRGALSGALALNALWGVFEHGDSAPGGTAMWDMMLVTVRYLVGIVVPAVMVYMAWACVRIRSNQSATGILYVAGILLLIGELTALALNADLGFPGV